MKYYRITLAAVAVITMAGAVLADLVVPELAAQHAFNDNWPPHAKFHDAQYMVMTVLLGIIGLVLLRSGPNLRGRLLCAAAILSTPWIGMIGALGFPGTANYDPEFHERTLFILGMHGQVFLAILLLVALSAAAVGVLRTGPTASRAP